MNTTATNHDRARPVPVGRGASAENLKQPCDPVVGRCDPWTDCAVAGHSPQSKDMPRLSRAYSGVAGAADIRPNAAAGIETPHGFSLLPPLAPVGLASTGESWLRQAVVDTESRPTDRSPGKSSGAEYHIAKNESVKRLTRGRSRIGGTAYRCRGGRLRGPSEGCTSTVRGSTPRGALIGQTLERPRTFAGVGRGVPSWDRINRLCFLSPPAATCRGSMKHEK